MLHPHFTSLVYFPVHPCLIHSNFSPGSICDVYMCVGLLGLVKHNSILYGSVTFVLNLLSSKKLFLCSQDTPTRKVP